MLKKLKNTAPAHLKKQFKGIYKKYKNETKKGQEPQRPQLPASALAGSRSHGPGPGGPSPGGPPPPP